MLLFCFSRGSICFNTSSRDTKAFEYYNYLSPLTVDIIPQVEEYFGPVNTDSMVITAFSEIASSIQCPAPSHDADLSAALLPICLPLVSP